MANLSDSDGRPRAADDGPWTLAELATICHDLARLERQLFVTLGAAARRAAPPLSPQVLATWCHRHAWHVELWEQRTPVVAGWFSADPPTTWAASTEIDAAVDALVSADAADGEGAEADGADGAAAEADSDALLTAIARGVATLDRALTLIEARLDDVIDPPTARVVTLVRHDTIDELVSLLPPEG